MIMSPQERAERRRKLRRARNIRRAAFLLLLVSILAAIAIARIAEKPEQAQEPEIIKAAITVPATTPEPETEIAEQPETPEETPEPVVIEQETPAAPEPSRYDSVEISEEDIYTLACLVYHEARGEPFEGQVAVIEVVLNRCLSEYFPDTVEEVVFQKYGDVWQFSPAPYIWSAEPTETQYLAVYTAIEAAEPVLPVETVFFSGAPYNEHIVATIGGHYFCTVN